MITGVEAFRLPSIDGSFASAGNVLASSSSTSTSSDSASAAAAVANSQPLPLSTAVCLSWIPPASLAETGFVAESAAASQTSSSSASAGGRYRLRPSSPPLLAYTIFFTTNRRAPLSRWPRRSVDSRIMRLVIRNLHVDRAYFLRMAAHNRYGRSPLSDVKVFRTPG
ncbi:unnamed protein product, partial [Protopolystoma xenopodis]